MYQIEVIDNATTVTVLCPYLRSAQAFIYDRLVRVMREDIATSVMWATMREIVSFYATQLARLDDFDKDEMATGTFESYNGNLHFKVTYKNIPYEN